MKKKNNKLNKNHLKDALMTNIAWTSADIKKNWIIVVLSAFLPILHTDKKIDIPLLSDKKRPNKFL